MRSNKSRHRPLRSPFALFGRLLPASNSVKCVIFLFFISFFVLIHFPGWHEKYPDMELFKPSEILKDLVARDKLGRKAGEGFYKYD